MMIYDRQIKLDLKIPTSICVVGVGGVGSWVALNLGLTGVKRLVLVDPDLVEETNLNRTPFRLLDVGKPKVTSITSILLLRRGNIKVYPLAKRVEDCNDYELSLIKDCEYVVDCRDTSDLLSFKSASKITGGYDGYSVTIHLNRKAGSVWGDEPTRYTVSPSWLVPPQFIASLVCLYLCTDLKENLKDELCFTFDIINSGIKEVNRDGKKEEEKE